jgi:hypothetical protein
MSKQINVNPDHYKVAGRERQGENVVHEVEKRALARLRREERQVGPDPKARNTQRTQTTQKTRKARRTAAVTADAGGVMRRARPARAAKASKKR